jgi:hypothetical protein
MNGFWYYANRDQPIGPLTLAELEAALFKLPEPHKALVWRTDFENWQEAQYVPALSAVLSNSSKNVKAGKYSSSQGRKWRGGLAAVVIVAGLAAARYLPSSEPDPNSPISGKEREKFIETGSASCLEHESDPGVRALSYTHEMIVSYCSCYNNAVADLTTVGDIKNFPKDGTTPPEMKRKIEKAESTCLEDLKKKLMQGQG